MMRRAFLHAGTHKTGTTSIQALLGTNEAALTAAGIFVPHTGRLAPDAGNHANLAWELVNPQRYDPRAGTLASLFAEIAASPFPNVCISSEEFEFLVHDPPAIRFVADGLRAAGYEPHVILYLRPQADYLESLYAELIIGGWTIGYEDFRRRIIAEGCYGQSLFDYGRLTLGFEEGFGRDRLHVRCYQGGASDDALLGDFLSIVGADGPPIDLAALQRPARLNRRRSLAAVVAAREQELGVVYAHSRSMPDTPFAPLTLTDLAELALVFWAANDAVFRRYGVRIPTVSARTLQREIMTTLIGGPQSRHDKYLIRSIVDMLDIAA